MKKIILSTLAGVTMLSISSASAEVNLHVTDSCDIVNAEANLCSDGRIVRDWTINELIASEEYGAYIELETPVNQLPEALRLNLPPVGAALYNSPLTLRYLIEVNAVRIPRTTSLTSRIPSVSCGEGCTTNLMSSEISSEERIQRELDRAERITLASEIKTAITNSGITEVNGDIIDTLIDEGLTSVSADDLRAASAAGTADALSSLPSDATDSQKSDAVAAQNPAYAAFQAAVANR